MSKLPALREKMPCGQYKLNLQCGIEWSLRWYVGAHSLGSIFNNAPHRTCKIQPEIKAPFSQSYVILAAVLFKYCEDKILLLSNLTIVHNIHGTTLRHCAHSRMWNINQLLVYLLITKVKFIMRLMKLDINVTCILCRQIVIYNYNKVSQRLTLRSK